MARSARRLTIAITLGLAPIAAADLVESVRNGPNDFAVRVTHMPDLDQLRLEAPGWTGCPTSSSNSFA